MVALSQCRFYLGFGNLFSTEILFHQGIIQLGKGLDQLGLDRAKASSFNSLGDRDLSEFGPQAVLIPYNPFQLDEIDHPDELDPQLRWGFGVIKGLAPRRSPSSSLFRRSLIRFGPSC